jgi:GH24 family phage-related lysozyme (muramidase)
MGQATEWLRNDLERFEGCVNRYVRVEMTQSQFDALASFTYNLGCGALKKSTLLRKLNAEDYSGAADEFGRWVKAGGRRLRGLVTRRAKERDVFLS